MSEGEGRLGSFMSMSTAMRNNVKLALRLATERRGAIGMIMAVAAVPLVMSVAVGVDTARLVQAQKTLQGAADGAALAGAAVYLDDSSASNAQKVGTQYFNTFSQAATVSLSNLAVTPKNGQYNSSNPGHSVTVDATATMATTFLSVANIKTLALKAHAVASNPQVQPVVTLGSVGSTAADWNSAYMYAVPTGANGLPDYTQFPPLSEFYEIGSNCSSTYNSNWTSKSACNGGFGATKPSNQTFPKISGNQAIAFMFVNMNNGMFPLGSPSYPGNQYGAKPGSYEIMTSAWMSLPPPSPGPQGPTYQTDNSPAIIKSLTGYTVSQPSTTYSSLNKSSTPNCALIVQQIDPNNIPSDPPNPGSCFSMSDTNSGVQFANLSCAQMAGRTFMYWWNDMGGSKDDFDYKNLYFTVKCVSGSVNPDGGTLQNQAAPPSASVGLSN